MSFFDTMERFNKRYSLVGDLPIFQNESFPWAQSVEADAPLILGELQAILQERHRIPNFHDVLDEGKLSSGDDWKTFFFFLAGQRINKNCDRCPATEAALKKIPGMKTAFFSILKPGKHIPAHRGPFNGVLRYHLGLIIPRESDKCVIRVHEQLVSWQSGKSIIFDDSYNHEVWNNTNEERVVLFVDFLRPLPYLPSILNRTLLYASGLYLKEVRNAKAYLSKN